MMNQKRTFTEDEYYLIWEFYSRCDLSGWFELDEITGNFDKIIKNISRLASIEGESLKEHRELFASESFDLKWQRLLNHMFRQRNMGWLPEDNLGSNLFAEYEDSLVLVLNLAKQSAVPEHTAKFVNPALLQQYTKEQAAFAKVQSIIDSLQVLRARNKAFPELAEPLYTLPEPVIF